MKAENISNSYFVSKYKICFEIFAEISYFVFFHSFFSIFLFKIQIFQKTSKLTLDFKFISHSKHQKLKLHEGLTCVTLT